MTRFGFVQSAIVERRSFAWKLAILILTVGGASLLRWGLGKAADPVPFVTYFPAIVFCALLTGWRFGVASIALSAAIVNLVFMDQPLRARESPQTALLLLLFLGSCLLLVAITQTLRRNFREVVEARQRAEFLNRELIHRGRNVLAVVQGIAQLSARGASEEFLPKFMDRLTALSRAHGALSKGDGNSADLRVLALETCAAFDHGGMWVDGPSVQIPREACVPLMLALHELSTNALKYGSLSVPAGKVTLKWQNPTDGLINLLWEESGGPRVAPPSREGLGRALLTRQPGIEQVDLQFDPLGVRCAMVVRTSAVSDRAKV